MNHNLTANEVSSGIARLASAGLNLCAILDTATLPETAVRMMVDSGVPLADYRRLVLFGHGGRRLWDALQARGMNGPDPIDHYSITCARDFIRHALGDPPVYRLYPEAPHLVPLQQLGAAAGWSAPSPLGSGIHPVYGVWFAYRAAFLVDADLPLLSDPPAPDRCAACGAKPCIAACPPGAVQVTAVDIERCARHRLRPSSPCADRCLARLACPYFPEHRYSEAQLQYHYRHSLRTLQDWYNEP